jgi:proliferating cell nuclear antigen
MNEMFRATLDNSKLWKQIVDSLATLLTETHFVASETGLTLHQLDASKAAMVSLDLPASAFQEYECDGEFEICLGMDDLVKVSRRMASSDKIEFGLDDHARRFIIKMSGKADREFKIQLLVPPEERQKRIAMEFDVNVEMPADAFKQAVKDIGVLSIHTKISTDGESLTFAGEGDMGEVIVVLNPAESEFVLTAGKAASSKYALNYLVDISKAMVGDTLIVQFSTNKPLHLEAPIADGGHIGFVLAPRVERR